MSPEQTPVRTVIIKRSPAKKVRKIQWHDNIDRTLAALVAVGGIIWTSVTGVNYLLDQRKAMPSYQDDMRMIEQPYQFGSINEKDILTGRNVSETRSYLLLLL